MATIVTRETAGTGATVKGSPLTNAEIDQNFINLNTELANASALTSGTVSGDRGVSAGSSTSSFIEYNGLTKTSGQFDGGAIAPTADVRLNYDGNFYATNFFGNGSNLTSITAGNLSGTIPSAVLGNSSLFIGTTSVALNRATGALSLTGVSIDGNAGTVTDGVVTTGSYSNPSWITALSETKVLPSQTGNSGKYLTTNGTSSSWATVTLPSGQTSGSSTAGYLQYNGTTKTAGQLDGGTTDPTNTTRLNYDGNFYATNLFGNIRATADVVIRGGGAATEGGQIVIGYGNNVATTITGQANSTWNIDVASGTANNDFRIFRQNSSGSTLVAIQITEATGAITVAGDLTVTGVLKGDMAVSIISTNTTAVTATAYILTASLTLTLPASPAVGDWVRVSNRSGTTTCIIARNGSNIMSLAEDMTVDTLNATLTLVYASAALGWTLI